MATDPEYRGSTAPLPNVVRRSFLPLSDEYEIEFEDDVVIRFTKSQMNVHSAADFVEGIKRLYAEAVEGQT